MTNEPPSLPRTRVRPSLARLALRVALAALVAPLVVPLSAQVAHAACPAPGGRPAADQAGPDGSDVVLHGHGFGHSLGMSQYGAQGAATLGCSSTQILQTYYPGLRVGEADLHHRVLIDMLTNGGTRGYASVTAEGGPVSWTNTSGTPRTEVQATGQTWVVRAVGGGLELRAGTAADARVVHRLGTGGGVRAQHTGTAVRVRTWGSTGAALLDRRASYDYTRVTADAAGLDVREVMEDGNGAQGVQKYLRGLTEMPLSWRSTAHQAQAVAARTYLAGRFSEAEQGYLILPTPAHQNWTGLTQEEADRAAGGALRAAVDATTTPTGGRVMLASSGALARDLLYTSSHGGWSESNAYVFGTSPVAHLRPVDDSAWDAASGNPRRSWTVGASWEQLARAFGFERVTDVQVAPQGSASRDRVRVTGVVGGVATTRAFTGWDSRQRLQGVLGSVVASPGFTVERPGIAGPGATPVTADVDGDGRSDVGWFRDGAWAFRTATGSEVRFSFGRRGDVPVTGDVADSGRDGIGVFRDGQWFLRRTASGGPAEVAFSYGRAGDVPVMGTWPGAARDGVGVKRGNRWYLRDSPSAGDARRAFTFGLATDAPTVGDWDGGGYDLPGLLRQGRWHLAGGVEDLRTRWSFAFGTAQDRPVAGDWDGDGRDGPGVVRGATFLGRDTPTGGPAQHSVTFRG